MSTKTNATWTTVLMPDAALERLQERVAQARKLSSAYGDFTTDLGIVGVFQRNRFDLRRQRFSASAGAMHAFGRVEAIPGGSRINVRFGRGVWVTWYRRGFVVFMLLLAAVQLIAGLRQFVFFVGAVFIAAIALLLLWSMRMRHEDLGMLRSFLNNTFADVEVQPKPEEGSITTTNTRPPSPPTV